SRTVSGMSRSGKVLRVASNSTTCSTACAGPRQFFLVSALRPCSPGGVLNALTAALRGGNPLTPSTHRLRRGLPGYLILFATHAFAPQRQLQTRESPSPLVFLHISAHFTATRGISLSSSVLKPPSFYLPVLVELLDVTYCLEGRLRARYALEFPPPAAPHELPRLLARR